MNRTPGHTLQIKINAGPKHHTQKYISKDNKTEITGKWKRHTKLDKGWAWVVMFATFCCQAIIGGLLQTSGIVRYALQESISEENLRYISWLGCLYFGLVSSAGILSSFLIHKFGCRTTLFIGTSIEVAGFVGCYFVNDEKMFFLTYSILAGSGAGITYTTVMVVLSYNFDKYLALASGISVTGQGVGLLVFSFPLNYCFEYFGMKASFLFMASVALQKYIFGSLLWPSNTEIALKNGLVSKENREVEVKKETSKSMLKIHLSLLCNFKFLNLLFCLLCFSTGEGIVYLMLPGYLISQGTSPDDAAAVLTLIGVFSILTRLLMGILANSDAADIFLLFLVPFGILGLSTLLLPFYIHLSAGQMMYGVLFGLYNCSVYALLNKLTVRIIGIPYLAAGFGLEMLIWGITGTIGTPLADSIAGWTGSLSSAFVFAGSMYVVSSAAALFLPLDYQKNEAETLYV